MESVEIVENSKKRIVKKETKLPESPCTTCPVFKGHCKCVEWKKWFRKSWRIVQESFGVERDNRNAINT